MSEFRACVLRVACDAFCSLPVALFAKKSAIFQNSSPLRFFFPAFLKNNTRTTFLERHCAPFESSSSVGKHRRRVHHRETFQRPRNRARDLRLRI